MRILEGIPLHFQIKTVSPFIQGARVQKITLSENRETCFEIRSHNQSGFFVLSSHPEICFFLLLTT
jgi:predicted ribosome quality control (RQC) complex YloA/Tae2 family protein